MGEAHRISGFLFVIAGAILIALSLLQFDFSVVMPMVLIPLVGFTALLYPYLLFRKLQKEGKA
jgi:sulfite exporter TauE/SafE